MLSDVGWLNVISTMGILIFGCSFGAYFIYQARKTKVKLLLFMGLAIFFNGLWYWGNFWESLAVLITGKNFDNVTGIAIPYSVQAIMSYVWPPVSSTLYTYVAASLITPRIKWYLTGYMAIASFIWEFFLFLSPLDSISIYIPPGLGTDLIDEDMIFGGVIFLLANMYVLQGIFFLGLGYLIKSRKSKDVVRKKYLYLSIGNFLSSLFAMLEGFGFVGVVLFFSRAGFILIFWLYYLGLREESIKVKVESLEKEVEIEDSLFRIRKRPTEITEAEVTYYKEQKICLVCKGKVGGFNTYICTGCDVLYCEKCARALTNAENVCWVCEEPIDKSKPVKPILIEGTEEGEKKQDTKTSELVK
ncbi:MAG: hypothetical protein ACFE92_12995 [Promethearchaeota archaeon]